MKKMLTALIFLTCSLYGQTQNIQGRYFATQSIDHRIDTMGWVEYYPSRYLLKHEWFFNVSVTIKDNQIFVVKQAVTRDSLGNKLYSDPSVNAYRYAGYLKKVDGWYVTHIQLTNSPALFPYVAGTSAWDERRPNEQALTPIKRRDQFGHRLHAYRDGKYTVWQEMLGQDLILRPDAEGVWINNAFYRKVKDGR
ncbi:hypothetical protein V9K67_17855 [Paraflavisolibacter sp. H34]|uniref:hypothetical protein n=1 Tax=Huijunlia imazamoxiresistens TaxID=3127457 RepID=UPI00301743AE